VCYTIGNPKLGVLPMSTRLLRTLMLTLPLLATSACQGGETDPKRAEAIEIGELSRQIQKSPDRAKSILKDAGYTEEKYKKAIFKIAKDPEQNEVYMKVLKGDKP